jgi:hypothetical protein
MALISENLKVCGVKVKTTVSGVPGIGSGIVYLTNNNVDYNYVLTAKHNFQEDSKTEINITYISNIEILYFEGESFKRLEFIKKSEISNKILVFEEDFAIIYIKKNENINFQPIVVSDELEDEDTDFFSWATFAANEDQLQKFDLKRNDFPMKRFKLEGVLRSEYLHGMSGAGVFLNNKSTLYGIICNYPNDDFQNNTVDCTRIPFSKINAKLKSSGRIELDTSASTHKREIRGIVVDIHQVTINDVILDLELARKRLKTDIRDDWYYDPLKYIDLLNQNYIFKQFEDFFNTDIYKARLAEQFYVPKKKLTLRQSLVSPFIDRLMYMASVGVIAEKMDSAMIPTIYSARYNKFSSENLIIQGVEQWKKMKYQLDKDINLKNVYDKYEYGCIIEIDLLNFYDNINKKLLFDKILRVCETVNEKNAAKLIYEIIKNFSKKELGLPQNSDASSLLASFYLNQVDAFMQHIAPAYYRFMDDIRIFCKDKYEARKILHTLETELRRCHLSVNSQKTEIFDLTENDEKRLAYSKLFDLELKKITRFRNSENYAYLNEAFHLSLAMLKENIHEDLNSSEDASRRLNYTLNTLAFLVKKDINIYTLDSKFKSSMDAAIESLKDRPWITTQVCRILNLLPSDIIKENFLDQIKRIVLEEKYNTYSFQTYQLWLLLAKHRCGLTDLKQYAVKQIEKNDETNRPVIAAMIIYMCSLEENYRRVTLRKFEEKFTHGYFQNRIALICLRSFDTDIIDKAHQDPTLKNAHEFLHKFKNKDLVFIDGFDEDELEEENYQQLYSI